MKPVNFIGYLMFAIGVAYGLFDQMTLRTEKYITLVVLKRIGTSYFREIMNRLDSNSCAQTPMDTQFWLWLLMLE